MLAITAPADERLTPARRAKFAYIYVRQSSVGQVRHHQESTELQYRLGRPRRRPGLAKGARQRHRRRSRQVRRRPGRAAWLPASDRRDRAGQRRPGGQLRRLAPGPQQSRLASAPGALLHLRRHHRRRRAPLRSRRLPRPPAASTIRHNERGRAAPNSHAATPGRVAEGGAGRATPAAFRRLRSRSLRPDRAGPRRGGAGPHPAGVPQVPRAAERPGGDAVPAPQRPASALTPADRACSPRVGLARGDLGAGAQRLAQPRLRWSLRLWPPRRQRPWPRTGGRPASVKVPIGQWKVCIPSAHLATSAGRAPRRSHIDSVALRLYMTECELWRRKMKPSALGARPHR